MIRFFALFDGFGLIRPAPASSLRPSPTSSPLPSDAAKISDIYVFLFHGVWRRGVKSLENEPGLWPSHPPTSVAAPREIDKLQRGISHALVAPVFPPPRRPVVPSPHPPASALPPAPRGP